MPNPHNDQKSVEELQKEIEEKVNVAQNMTEEEDEKETLVEEGEEEETSKEDPKEDTQEDETEDEEEESTEEDETEEEEEDQNEEEEEEPEEKKTSKKEETKRLKDKLSASAREAQILFSKNKKMTEAIEQASDVPEPTEEEMIAEYPDWEEMSNFEQKMAKSDVKKTRQLEAISAVSKDFKDLDAWTKKVDEFVTDPETLAYNPDLDGREDEFRAFSLKETRRGVDFDVLVKAFLFEVETDKPQKKKGKMFETGSGGLNKKPPKKDDRLSVEEGTRLKNTNYKKYIELLQKGKIRTEVD